MRRRFSLAACEQRQLITYLALESFYASFHTYTTYKELDYLRHLTYLGTYLRPPTLKKRIFKPLPPTFKSIHIPIQPIPDTPIHSCRIYKPPIVLIHTSFSLFPAISLWPSHHLPSPGFSLPRIILRVPPFSPPFPFSNSPSIMSLRWRCRSRA